MAVSQLLKEFSGFYGTLIFVTLSQTPSSGAYTVPFYTLTHKLFVCQVSVEHIQNKDFLILGNWIQEDQRSTSKSS